MKNIFSLKNIVTILSVMVFFADLYLLCVFPSNLVLDLFCGRMGKEELDNLEYNYGQIAGYPAGKDAPVLENIEQFQAYEGRGYITFETDSIIPMNAYRLKSASDRTNNTYRRVGNRVSSGRQWHTYSITRPLTKAYIYNRYYLVKLPDGNYVAAYLEDAYYWKYKLAGKVQLPLGQIESMQPQEKEMLGSYIEEYGADGEKLLSMLSVERYEQQKGLYTTVQLVVFIVVLAAYAAVILLIRKAIYRVGR